MNRKFLRNCSIFGILGVLVIGAGIAIWFIFLGGSGGGLPIVTLIQPNSNVTMVSGQGLVFIVEAQSDIGISRIELLVDGQVEKSVSVFNFKQFQATFP
ncbi:MAG: Ig-like domain-containing protein, partial [Anaerolineae bacterium]|nr:Ig-like domain-containing protein [Anaerolineae bacterium]